MSNLHTRKKQKFDHMGGLIKLEVQDQKTEHKDLYGILKKHIADFGEIKWKNTVSYVTYKRTYARRLSEDLDSKTEELPQTLFRVIVACNEQLGMNLTPVEQCEYFDIFANFKALPAGRFLWQLGTQTVKKYGLLSLQNCAYTEVKDIESFCWVFDCLMLGSGTGYNVQPEYTNMLPIPFVITASRMDTNDADFIVPDSREGWIELLRYLLRSHFMNGFCEKGSFTYSTLCLRSKGAPIRGFGGTASGPEHLCSGITDINKIINSRARDGLRMRPIDCLDLMNIIARMVISGNVRRCLPADSKVFTKKGLINIQDIEIGTEVLTFNGYHEVKNKFNQGVQSLTTITTQNGTFKCTPAHKMSVMSSSTEYEWVEASQLKKGDILMTNKEAIDGELTSLPPPLFSSRDTLTIPMLDADMAWFVGVLHSNRHTRGEFDESLSITFSTSERKEMIKTIRQLQRFGESLRITSKKEKTGDHYIVQCRSNQLVLYFDKYMEQTNRPGKIHVPGFINKAKTNIKLAYVSGITGAGKYPESGPASIVSTAYYEFAKDIQILLYSCGIGSRLTVSEQNGLKQNLGNRDIQTRYIINLTPESQYKAQTRVVSVHHDNMDLAHTYDIEVENVHEFFCNGYLTHNSAQIAIGDANDIEFLNAKRWDKGNIPNWRCFSNNSVVCDDIKTLPDEFWEGYKGNGECYGLINLKLSQKIGRTGETQYPDPDVTGYNPSMRKGTRVLTSSGIVTIETLENRFFEVRNIDGGWSRARCWKSGLNKPLYKITLSNKKEYWCTSEHKWPVLGVTSDNVQKIIKTSTADLKQGTRLPYMINKTLSGPVASQYHDASHATSHATRPVGSYTDGFCLAMLYTSPVQFVKKDYDASNKREKQPIYTWCIYNNLHNDVYKKILVSWMNSIDHSIIQACEISDDFKRTYTAYSMRGKRFSDYMETFGISSHDEIKTKTYGLPHAIWNGTEDFRRGFIDGLFSLTGGIDSSHNSLRIHSSCSLFIHDVSDLLGFYGIISTINPSVVDPLAAANALPLFVATFSGDLFSQMFRITNTLKQKHLDTLEKTVHGQTGSIEIISCELSNLTEDVWDVTVYDTSHMFSLSHCFTGNCGEQSLSNLETCCLQELFLPNIDSQEELIKCAKYMYRIAKHSMSLPCHQKATERVVHKNMRMGIGITGVLQVPKRMDWLSKTYEQLREFDKIYSQEHGFPPSIKLTTVKPSGCVVPETIIKTSNGDKSLLNIFKGQGIEVVSNQHATKKWYNVGVPLFVRDMNNNLQKVTKLYDNGIEDVISVHIGGEKIICTPDHKFRVLRAAGPTSGRTASYEWIAAKNLKKGDTIKSY